MTDFTPKSGGGKKKMIIYGSNFGTDRSIISVKIGGKEAIAVSYTHLDVYKRQARKESFCKCR